MRWGLLVISQVLFAAQPTVQAWQSNSVPVWFVSSRMLPMLDIAFVFDAGSVREGNVKGLAAMTNELLFAGCGNESESEVAKVFESHGARFYGEKGYDGASANIRILTDKRHLMPVVKQFASCIQRPKFAAAALLRTKKQHSVAAAAKDKNATSLAIKAFKGQYYKQHAYARYNIAGSNDIKAITRAKVISFYKNNYTKRSGHLILVGDIDIDQAKKIANELTRGLAQGRPRVNLSELVPQKAKAQDLSLPNQVQATTVISQPGKKYDSEAILYKLLNVPLGWGLSSRMYKKVREQNGYVYAINTMFVMRKYAGEFYLFFQSRPEVANAATKAALEVLRQYIAQGPTESELVHAKKVVLQSIYRDRITNAGLVSELKNLVVNNRSYQDFYSLESKVKLATVTRLKHLLGALFNNSKPIKIMVHNAKS